MGPGNALEGLPADLLLPLLLLLLLLLLLHPPPPPSSCSSSSPAPCPGGRTRRAPAPPCPAPPSPAPGWTRGWGASPWQSSACCPPPWSPDGLVFHSGRRSCRRRCRRWGSSRSCGSSTWSCRSTPGAASRSSQAS